VRTNEIDCLIRLGGGPYGELALVAIPSPASAGDPPEALHFLCKPGLADCRQSRAILESLLEHAGSKTPLSA
jgi:hypothetical protein